MLSDEAVPIYIFPYTLPVYSLHRGKLHFDTEEEKREFIDKHRQQCS